jgi:hypothetical protein
MVLPDVVEIKFGAYTLICRKLMESLSQLDEALAEGTRVTRRSVISVIDDCLSSLFSNSIPANLNEAVGLLGNLILAQSAMLRSDNPKAVEILEQMIAIAESAASTWRYQDDIEEHHDLGRLLAVNFYKRCPNPALFTNLSSKCRLKYEYGESDSEESEKREIAFGYSVAPTSTRRKKSIFVRFAFDNNFELYLCYPFLFLHEYVSHVFPNDLGNLRFNDGWMLHAADYYWLRERKRNPQSPQPACMEQVYAFDYLFPRIRGASRDACVFARRFQDTMDESEGQLSFDEITFQLAAFVPAVDEKPSWPNTFLNKVEASFRNLGLLRRRLGETDDIRELFQRLA